MYLCRSQENQPELLALYAVDSTGHLYDPETVEFRVIDLSDNSQVFPASGYEDVTADGRVAKGVYYAYDTGALAGWTPASDATVGRYRIDWRFTDADDDAVTRTWSFKFDIYTAGYEIGYWTYLSPNKIRAEGITTSQLSDARAIDLIARAQQYIEQECKQPFRPIQHTIEFDGHGGFAFHAPIPILGVDEFKVNSSDVALDQDNYRVYYSPSLGRDPGYRPRDNRRNPKVQIVTGQSGSPFRPGGIFSPSASGRLQHDAKAHSLKGVYGFVEADGTTPALIEDAMLRIVLATAVMMETGPGGSGGFIAGPITAERTDQHEVSYGFSYTAGSADSALATSQEVLDIVRKYRAPIFVGSPATTWQTMRP